MERESINRQQKLPPVPELPYSKNQIPNDPPTQNKLFGKQRNKHKQAS